MKLKTIKSMKRIITIAVLALACTSMFAQKAPRDASYSTLKNYYNPSDYVKSDADPYSVGWAGFTSFFSPGTSQLIMKENRGWAFLGASVAIDILGNDSIDGLRKSITTDANNDLVVIDGMESTFRKSVIGVVAAGALLLTDAIWSCIDARKVAKVKNMYYQDLSNNRSLSATLYPSFDLTRTGTAVVPTTGMTLAVKF